MENPIVPTPGIRPIQLEKRIMIKRVPKNQKVRLARDSPRIPLMKLIRLSRIHSTVFWRRLGTKVIFLVANWATTIRKIATMSIIRVELVNLNQPSSKSTSALAGRWSWPSAAITQGAEPRSTAKIRVKNRMNENIAVAQRDELAGFNETNHF